MPSSCELVRCEYYIGGKCADKREYVNEAGEAVCYRHEDAMPAKEYYGDTCPACAKLQAQLQVERDRVERYRQALNCGCFDGKIILRCGKGFEVGDAPCPKCAEIRKEARGE